MARNLVLRNRAQQDLQELYEYISARNGPEAAIVFIRQIRAFCENLATMPHRGWRADDIRPGLRVASWRRRVAVAFLVTDDTVRIGRVSYRGRDLLALLADDDGQEQD